MAIKVRCKKVRGYYGNKRRFIGECFYIEKEEEFSDKWMDKVDEDAVDEIVQEEGRRPIPLSQVGKKKTKKKK